MRCRTSGVVELIGPEHFFDSVKAAKKGRHPDGLPMFGSRRPARADHGQAEFDEGIDAAEVAGSPGTAAAAAKA